MFEITAILLSLPLVLAAGAGLIFLMDYTRQQAHIRAKDMLKTQAEVYTLARDALGNLPGIYLPEEKRILTAPAGNSAPQYPALTHYAPHTTTTLNGKPLNVGGAGADQRSIQINSWLKPATHPAEGEPPEVDTEEGNFNFEESAQIQQPASVLPAPEPEPTPEVAAKHLLNTGLSLMQVSAATGLSVWQVRKAKAELSVSDLV